MENSFQEWLLFLPQIPSSPSSLRVTVWRKMRAIGAIGLQNGVWILPNTQTHTAALQELRAELAKNKADGFLFVARNLVGEADHEIIERFRQDRDEEYQEFFDSCEHLLAEIQKETDRQYFTFAELEESEQDLHKLTSWLRKIQSRDMFKASQAGKALNMLAECQEALKKYTQQVYLQAGIAPLEGETAE